jgi:hypothetical protein
VLRDLLNGNSTSLASTAIATDTSPLVSPPFARLLLRQPNPSPSVTPYHPTATTIARNMKIKKLTAVLAAMPFGIAAAFTAPDSAPNYHNVSMNGTAAMNPYVSFSFFISTSTCLTLAFFLSRTRPYLAPKEPLPAAHHAGRLSGSFRCDACSTLSTLLHFTPHSAQYKVIAAIELHQNVIHTYQPTRQVGPIRRHNFCQLVQHSY